MFLSAPELRSGFSGACLRSLSALLLWLAEETRRVNTGLAVVPPASAIPLHGSAAVVVVFFLELGGLLV
jgi:hypothetical protein